MCVHYGSGVVGSDGIGLGSVGMGVVGCNCGLAGMLALGLWLELEFMGTCVWTEKGKSYEGSNWAYPIDLNCCPRVLGSLITLVCWSWCLAVRLLCVIRAWTMVFDGEASLQTFAVIVQLLDQITITVRGLTWTLNFGILRKPSQLTFGIKSEK